MPYSVNPCSYLPRRLQIVSSLTLFLLFSIIFLGSSTAPAPYLDRVPYGPQFQEGAHEIVDHLPNVQKLNPFGKPAHKPPPEQKNSSVGQVKWFSHFKWRNPFSSSTTMDEERAVLPPLRDRPPVYTYFDASTARKGEKTKDAEQDLLQTWRRAWWAQGFKPVVLGPPEAMNNPFYRRVQGLKLEHELELEMMRWLAWANMGTGILSNWLAVPMAPHDDPLLSFMRRGEYPSLTRYKGLDNGLFIGNKEDIEQALTAALSSPNLHNATALHEVVPDDTFTIDPEHKAIAFYSASTIGSKYRQVREKLDKEETHGEGLAMLSPLINSHLHMIWQNTFSKGIAVLKPSAQYTTSIIKPAIELARNLSQCSDTPIPSSCPPNMASCKTCVSSQGMNIVTPPVFRNKSNIFTIGTVPHPFTFQSLINSEGNMDLAFIRRKTNRDSWILATTKELLGTGISSFARLAPFKDAVASEFGSFRSLWLTVEDSPKIYHETDLAELDWLFGFKIPREPLNNGKSETPVPGPERRPPPPKQEFEGPEPSQETLELQGSLTESSKRMVRNGEKGGDKVAMRTREIIESWNLADTEAWKFVRAWNARRMMERKSFEDEEEHFLGKGTYERWKDFVTNEH